MAHTAKRRNGGQSETVLLYVSEKAVFDADLRNMLNAKYDELLAATRQRTLDPSSSEKLSRFGAELEKKEQFFAAFSQATDDQLIRLRDL